MKNLSAFMLKIDTFNDVSVDTILDVIIEKFVLRNLRATNGWNTMVDNENKTFIFFVDFSIKEEMYNMIKELNKISTDTPSILFFEDITDDLLHASVYDNYKNTCDKTKEFVSENLEIDFILEKITKSGMGSLLDVELSVLSA